MDANPTRTPEPAPVEAIPRTSHFERLGGEPGLRRLVEAFYAAMDRLPEAATIRAMHAPDLGPTADVLVTYLCEWTGGPRRYSDSRGAPMLRRRHHPFDIDAAARDAWMRCMRTALSEVVTDAPLRDELDAAFWKIADFIRNTEPGGTARPHPGRPREAPAHELATATTAHGLVPLPASIQPPPSPSDSQPTFTTTPWSHTP